MSKEYSTKAFFHPSVSFLNLTPTHYQDEWAYFPGQLGIISSRGLYVQRIL